MLQGEVLIGEGLGPVDAGRACAVAIKEVAALTHEVFNLCEEPSIGQSVLFKKKKKTRTKISMTRWIGGDR
jgi:hypothetical protein